MKKLKTEPECQDKVLVKDHLDNGDSTTNCLSTDTNHVLSDAVLNDFYHNKSRAADLFDAAMKPDISHINPDRLKLFNETGKLPDIDLDVDFEIDTNSISSILYEYQDESGHEYYISLFLVKQSQGDDSMLRFLLDYDYVLTSDWIRRELPATEDEQKDTLKNPNAKKYLPVVCSIVLHYGPGLWDESLSFNGGFLQLGYSVIEIEDLKELCENPDNKDLSILLSLMHGHKNEKEESQERIVRQGDKKTRNKEFQSQLLKSSEDVIRVAAAVAGEPDKAKEWIERKRKENR